MQHLGVNFGALNLVFFCFFLGGGIFLLKKSGLMFKSPEATLTHTGSLHHALFTHIVQCHYLSVLIHDHVMHPKTSVNSVNEHY